KLYGTASAGGSKYAGSIFQLTLGGILNSVASFFGGFDGAYPYGRLLQTADGNYYGTTVQGGAAGLGTIFRMTPSGAITYLRSFFGGAGGGKPVAAVNVGDDGTSYCTVFVGGGR